MPELAGGQTIEVVRDRLDDDLGGRILALFSEREGLEGSAALERLREVICVLRDSDGEVVGVNSAHDEPLPLIGGRRLWVYRAAISPQFADGEASMFSAAFEELDRAYQSDRRDPAGVCVLVTEPEEMRRRPEAVWEDTALFYAGTDEVGRQLRLRYFYDATVGPGYPSSPTTAESLAQDYSLEPGYRLVPLAETELVGPDDILELWSRETGMPEDEAERRVHEALLVALDPEDRLAGLTTAYLQRNPQLGLDVWYLRGFVSSQNRLANLAVRLLWASRDHLSHRFVSGEDTRAPGIVMEIENRGLMRYFNRAYWVYSDFFFIGENEADAHLVVHWFPGATVPAPTPG